MKFRKKKSSPWQSARSGKSQPRQRVEEAVAKGDVRQQVRELGSSDRGKMLMFGDLLLFWSETVPGRVALAIVSLVLAWILL